MWLCSAYKDGKLVATSYEDNQDWFKSMHSSCDKFTFKRVN